MSELRPAESTYICLNCKYILNVKTCPKCGEKDLATVWEVISVLAGYWPKEQKKGQQALFSKENT